VFWYHKQILNFGGAVLGVRSQLGQELVIYFYLLDALSAAKRVREGQLYLNREYRFAQKVNPIPNNQCIVLNYSWIFCPQDFKVKFEGKRRTRI